MVATIIPFGSEAYFITLLSLGKYNGLLLLTAVSIGNILGSLFNWVCGYYVNYFIKKSWFPINNKMIDRANKIFNKYGKWSLIIILGAFYWRSNYFCCRNSPLFTVIPFLVFVSIGKVGRYLLVYLSITLDNKNFLI